jgi:hypothetical protein
MEKQAAPALHSLSNDISVLRSRLRKVHDSQLELLHVMMDCGPMIMGSVYQTYRTCSYPNCRCHSGQKHGPFPSISFSIDGKHKSRPIRRDDVTEVERKASAYKRFQNALMRWRANNRESETILERIRELSAGHYK